MFSSIGFKLIPLEVGVEWNGRRCSFSMSLFNGCLPQQVSQVLRQRDGRREADSLGVWAEVRACRAHPSGEQNVCQEAAGGEAGPAA